jgi:hypothetical protein
MEKDPERTSSINGSVVTVVLADPTRGASKDEVKEEKRSGSSEPTTRSESLPSEGSTTQSSTSARSSLMDPPSERSQSTDVSTKEEDVSLPQTYPTPLMESATTPYMNENIKPYWFMDRTQGVLDRRLSETRSMASLSTVRGMNDETATPVQDAPGTKEWELTPGRIVDSPIEAPQSGILLNDLISASTASGGCVEEDGSPRGHTGSTLEPTTSDERYVNPSGEINPQVRNVFGLLMFVI